jgi:hypothetical protein
MPRLVVVVGVLAVLAAATGSAQSPPPAPLSITALVDQAVALFPKVEGDVIEAQEQTLTLSVGRRAGVQPGLVLETFREGREIRHPKTGAVLGKTEEPVGRAVVTKIFDGYSIATGEGGQAKAGDRVRTSANRVKVMVLALKGGGVRDALVEAATNEVYEALNRTGRFQLVTGDQIAAWLSQERIAGEEFLRGRGVREALQRFKAENVLALHFTMVERKPFVDARLFAAGRPDPALSTAFFVPPSIKPTPREAFSSGGKAPAPEKKTQSLLARLLGIEADRATYSSGEGALALKEIARMGFAIVGMDVSTAPADQIPRLVLSDGERVNVYRIVNRVLEPDWTFHARSLGRVISVQLADITGDGTLSVVANRFDSRIGMSSFIVSPRGGKPALLVDHFDAFIYAVDDKGVGVKQTLWTQPYSEESFFRPGQADKVVLRNGSLVREHAVSVPEPFRATGATFANITGKGSHALVYIDAQNRLRISSGTEEIWRSTTLVGGGGPKIEVFRQGYERGGRSFFYQMEPVPLAADLDGDGVQEIVVPQNKEENGVLAVVYRSAAGIRFQQISSGFEGIIGGFAALPGDDGGSPTLITAVVRYRSLLRAGGDTRIIMTVAE